MAQPGGITMRILKSAALVFTLGFFSLSAQAMSIQWTLKDALFDDGTSLTGSFFFDADTNTYSSINILTLAGTLTGRTYDTLTPIAQSATKLDLLFDAAAGGFTGDDRLLLLFVSALTNAGGTVDLSTAVGTRTREGTCANATCSGTLPTRFLTAGSVMTALPEPGTLSLLAIGLAGIAWVRRRKVA